MAIYFEIFKISLVVEIKKEEEEEEEDDFARYNLL